LGWRNSRELRRERTAKENRAIKGKERKGKERKESTRTGRIEWNGMD